MRKLSISLIGLVICLGASRPASASLITYTTAGCAGFETCTNAAFDSAIGTPSLFLSFSTDKFGAALPSFPAPGGSVAGTIFSDFVTFSTAPSAFNPSGAATVHATAPGAGSEIGPDPLWDGILRMVFASPVTAVGFGTVEGSPPFNPGAIDRIRIYDVGGMLLGSFADASSSVFDYFGVIATGGTQIGRVELQGTYSAIQDLTVVAAPVPEPASLVLLGAGLAALARTRRRARRS